MLVSTTLRSCTFILLLLNVLTLSAQQDQMFTKYFFNTLAYNPAYAGSREHLSIAALVREQWAGWNQGAAAENGGAPRSQNLTIHTPWHERIGLGLSLFNDKAGATGSSGFNFSYAYRIPFGDSKLSIGVNGGAAYWRANWDELAFKDPRELDPVFAGNNPNRWIPTVGAGLFFYNDNFYAGFSVPRLFSYELRDPDPAMVQTAQIYRHYYFTAGGAIPLRGDDLIFKPSLLVKSVGMFGDYAAGGKNAGRVGAPTEFETDLSLLFYEKLWLGVAFRSTFAEIFSDKSSHDSADVWAAFYLRNGMRIGLAYDLPLTRILQHSAGSFELLLAYDFEYKVRKVLTPRYF